MKTALFLFAAGLTTELVWAWAVVALEHRWLASCLLLAFLSPFLQMLVTAFTTVDETHWRGRTARTATFAAGAVVGIVVIAWLFW